MERRKAVSARVPLLILALAAMTLASHREAPARQGGSTSAASQQGDKPTPLPFRLDDAMRRRPTRVSQFVRQHNAEYYDSDTLHTWYYSDVDCLLEVRTLRRSNNIPKQNDRTNGYIVALITAVNNCRWKDFRLDSKRTAAWFVRFDERRARSTGKPPIDEVGETAFILLAQAAGDTDQWIGKNRWRIGYCLHDSNSFRQDSVAILTTKTLCNEVHSQQGRGRGDDSSEPEEFQAQPPVFRAADEGMAGWFACGGDCCYGRQIL